jgi:hypothetical protein
VNATAKLLATNVKYSSGSCRENASNWLRINATFAASLRWSDLINRILNRMGRAAFTTRFSPVYGDANNF